MTSPQKNPGSGEPASGTLKESPLGRLGRGVVRHPWYALGVWIVILLLCLLPAANVGKVISGGFSSPLPSGDESVQAQNAYVAEFPHAQSAPSSAIVVLEASDIVGPVGKNATLAVTQALAQDPRLKNVSSVISLYSAYSGYLEGQVDLGWSFLGPALSATPSLPAGVNQSASTIWSPTLKYVQTWTGIVANQTPGTPAPQADWPAFLQTRAGLAGNAVETQLLTDFYNGSGSPSVGFNQSLNAGCLGSHNVTTCANAAMWSSLPAVIPTTFTAPGTALPASLALSNLNLWNWSNPAAQQAVSASVLGAEVGISPAWVLTIWKAFPSSTPPSSAAVGAWVTAEVTENSIGEFPLPVPRAIYSSFVNPTASATLIVVSFGVDDSYMVNGSSVNFADVSEIQSEVSKALSSSPADAQIAPYVTGGAALDSATTYLATSALSLLLILTIVVLLVIMLLYFRSPSAPLLAFGMIGIALVSTLAVVYAVGTYVTTFNSEIESIVLVFLMSIGTDYSVFLLARYREELVRGTPPKEAVATTVRWAGQSITTSGLAVEVVAVALMFSGISFLSQLGIALFVAVFFALLVNLTVLPSILVLVGPRVFWPNSGKRFERYAGRRKENIETHRDFIARAGRAATTRPVAVVGLILLLSIPVVWVAIQVPVSYDVTNIGLPPSNSAQIGFVHLTNDFGDSYSSPSYVLVTFAAPLMTSGSPNDIEFQDIQGLANTMNATPGVADVMTLVGSGGAPLAAWQNFANLPSAVKIGLNETLASYVGFDGRTVFFNVQTASSGFSAPAIGVIDNLEQRVRSFDGSHPEVTKASFGGAAPTTEDIRTLVNTAEEEMLIGAVLGLFVLMLLILGSAFVPLLALGVIGLSILWSWASTYFVVGIVEGEALIFLLPLILLILVLGLGMDYNVLLLTRVKEERTRGNRGAQAIKDAVTHAGGVITAAAVILGGAFLLLGFTSPLALLAAIGLGIGFAVLLQAFVVQLFFTPAVLTLGKDWIWKGRRRSR